MSVCSPLRTLVDFVEDVEANAGEVSCVQLPDRITTETPLSTRMEVTVPIGSAVEGSGDLSLLSASVDSEGSLRFAFETTADIVPTRADDVATEVTEATLNPDGTVTAVLSVAVSDDEEAHFAPDSSVLDDSNATALDRTSAGSGVAPRSLSATATPTARDRDLPPFEDRELLAEVYESCDTFAEMSDALDMDVTAETVRRYMIDHGIHEAASYNTNSAEADVGDDAEIDAAVDPVDTESVDAVDADIDASEDGVDSVSTASSADSVEETPVILADGIGLSENVDVETLIEAVRESRTIHEVKDKIEMDREDAVDTLRELNLLDLVVGRLSEDGSSEVTRTEIVDRLRAVSATR